MRQSSFFLVLVSVFLFTSPTFAGQSRQCSGAECLSSVAGSIEVGVSQKAIDYAREELVRPALTAANIVTKRMDDPNKMDFFKGLDEKTRVVSIALGSKMHLDELFLTTFDLDPQRTEVKFQAPANIAIHLRGLKLEMMMHMGFKGLFGGKWKPRTVKVIVKDAELTLNFALGVENGRPTLQSVTAPDLVLKRDNFDIQWLTTDEEKPKGFFNWLINLFEGLITRILSSQLKKKFNENFNPKMAASLRSMPTEFRVAKPQLPKPIMVKAKLNRAPSVSSQGIRLSLDGDVAVEGSTCPKDKCPDTGKGLGIPARFVNVLLSERLPCCAIRAGFSMGLFSNIVKPVPTPAFPSTNGVDKIKDAVAPILSKIFSTYVIMYKVDVPVEPVVRFQDGNKVDVAASVNAEVHLVKVANKDAPLTPATRMVYVSASATARAATRISGKVLHYELERAAIELGKLELRPGQVVPENIKNAITGFANWIISKEVIAKVNTIIAGGFEIPSVQGLTLTNPSLLIAKGALEVNSDFTYKFPSEAITQMLLNL